MSIIATLFAIVMMLASFVMRPSHGSCPPGWWLDRGVTPSGRYRCASPLPACCEDAKGPCEHVTCPAPAHVESRVYCTGASVPIVVDSRTVGCTRLGG